MAKDTETTAKFKADITELKSAFQEASRQVRLANSEFKAATAGMDNWNQSADGLSAKITQLNGVLSAQKSQLSSLEKQYELTVQQQGANSKGAEELEIKINQQKAAIGNTEKQLKNYTSQLDDLKSESGNAESESEELADSVEKAGDSAENSSGGFSVLKGALANLVSEGINKVLDGLKDLTTDSSNAYSQFAAATGTATDAMGEYQTAIENVYKNNFGDSLEDVAGKMAKVKEITGEIDPSNLQTMTEKAITLEDVFGMDMSESLRGVQSLMDHFGISSEEAFDLMSSGAQQGLNYSDELGDNIAEYAGKFAEAGFSADEYFQYLQNGSQGGAYNLDKVNDSLNEVTTRLADGTIEGALDSFDSNTQEVFKAWQDGKATQQDVVNAIVQNIKNTTNEQDKMNLAATAFGTMAEDGGTKFVESLSSVGDSFDNVKGKADELADVKYDTPQSALQGIGRTLKVDMLQPIVDKLMPYLNKAAAWVTANLPAITQKVMDIGGKIKDEVVPAVKNVFEWIQKLSPVIAAVGTAIAGLAVVGLIQNLGAIGVALKTWAMSTKLVTAAQWLLNAAMSANPIALVVIAIAALVAAFVVLWNKSEAFRNFWINLWDNVKAVASTAWEAITGFFSAAWDTIKAVWDVVLGYFQTLWAGIQTTFSVVSEVLSGFFSAAWNAIKAIWDFVVGYYQGIWNGIKAVFSVVSSVLTSFFSAAWNGIKAVWNAVVAYYQGIWDGIKAVFSVVSSVLTEFFSAAWNGIKGIWDAVSGYFSGIWESVKSVFSGVESWFQSIFSAAWTAVQGVFSNFGSFFQGLWDTIKSTFSNLGSSLSDAIGGAVKSGLNGVLSMIENTINNGIGLINGAIGLINALPGVNVGTIGELSLPRLAKGGIVDNATTAIIGEDGREAVIPLERNTKWIDVMASKLASKLSSGGYTSTQSTANSVVNNFYQTNNSPKALSRLEIYRQSRNLLNFKGV